MDPIYLADIVNVRNIFPYRGHYGTHVWNEMCFFFAPQLLFMQVLELMTTKDTVLKTSELQFKSPSTVLEISCLLSVFATESSGRYTME